MSDEQRQLGRKSTESRQLELATSSGQKNNIVTEFSGVWDRAHFQTPPEADGERDC